MINTFLFDLDGTLLPLDMERFLQIYFDEMAKKLYKVVDPELTPKYIWEATEYMIRNTDMEITNMEAFSIRFNQISKSSFEELLPLFDEFYQGEYLKTKEACSPNPMVREIIGLLKEKGIDLVLATNPLFPKNAINYRIQWAGLNPDDFIFITSYENMHACKPSIQYFQEILDIIGRSAEECMMVGNDVQEDMIAAKLGMKTFLLEDQMIHRNQEPICYDYKGSYIQLKNYIEENF